ncbi:MAG: hypothetical protein H6738_13750 [Alphaproteobacteria bacterium]|nr:hypothetical protein [Alphaproteobacteria bacterium]MCB9697840.1 hypothetical protein [Alphaproteobacteria bacterium]
MSLGSTLVVGDPSELLAAPGTGRWHGTAVKPGTWHVLARPGDDPDQLVEIILVHEDGLRPFWDLYDLCAPAAAMLLPTARVIVVDGRSRTDAELLRAAAEPDDLPWMLDHGLVAFGIAQHPAHVWQPRDATEALLVAVALDRAPSHAVPTDPHQSQGGPSDDDGG